MTEIFSREQAKESDRVLYGLMMVVAKAQYQLDGQFDSAHYMAGDAYRRRYDSRSGWKMSDQEAVDKLVALATGEVWPNHKRADAERQLQRIKDAQGALAAAEAAKAEQDKEWAAHGRWPRYTVVPGGHIHSDMGCFTFHRGRGRTDVRWAYPVSGDTVEDAIEVYGEALCTHCYPDAPVAKTLDTIGMDADGNPMTKAERQAVKDARDAEKAAVLAAKNASAVVDPDTGEVLFKTERGATNSIASTLKDMRWYDFKHPSQDEWEGYVQRWVAAVAAKRNVDPVELRKEFDARADKAAAAATKKAWKELKQDCASGRWTRSMVNMDSSTVQYGKSIGEELVFSREDR